MRILFLHGWQSVPGGVKPTFLKDHGHEVINPKLPDDDFTEAVRIAQTEFNTHRPQVVVGSSRGGAVAMTIDSGEAKLVLLCPAWKKYGPVKAVKPDTVILHSRADDVVPFADSEELAVTGRATLIEVGNDHRLADPESLATMLRACGDATMVLNTGDVVRVVVRQPAARCRSEHGPDLGPDLGPQHVPLHVPRHVPSNSGVFGDRSFRIKLASNIRVPQGRHASAAQSRT